MGQIKKFPDSGLKQVSLKLVILILIFKTGHKINKCLFVFG